MGRSRSGRKMIFLAGYGFTQRSRNSYACTNYPSCQAKLRLNEEGKIIDSFTKHYHTPKKYAKSEDGTYSVERKTHISTN